jgi:hypothetical protein
LISQTIHAQLSNENIENNIVLSEKILMDDFNLQRERIKDKRCECPLRRIMGLGYM